MQNLNHVERSPIQNLSAQSYQYFGCGKQFLAGTLKDQDSMRHCALMDLTHLARVGFRGKDTADYLTEHGFILPTVPNQVVQQQDGCYVARLSATEYLLLGSLADFGEKMTALEQGWKMDDRQNYLLARQDSHVCFQLTGQFNAQIMAKLCAVDLSETAFAVGGVVQSSVARLNAIIMNVSDAQSQKFNLFCDRSAALYFWEVLLDAMQEFKGQVIGIEAVI